MAADGTIYFVMGVSGSGKTTLGTALAQQLQLPFFDGDDFHPAGNIEKMSRGIPLQDADREGWLQRLNALAKDYASRGAVIACSALKQRYRELLESELQGPVLWIFLSGTYQEIEERIKKREGHYMPPSLLRSQFDVLEAPDHAIEVPVSDSLEEAMDRLRDILAPGEPPS